MPRSHTPVVSTVAGAHDVGDPIVAVLDGHLTRDKLQHALERVAAQLETRGRASVIIDSRTMPSYDLDARHAFVDWNVKWSGSLHRVAIVTHSRLHMLVIATMAMATRRPMKGFVEFADADAWARAGDIDR